MITVRTWAIVGALKGAVPLRPQQLALLVSAVLAGSAYAAGYLQGNAFEVGASAILATLTALAAQRMQRAARIGLG